MKPARVLRGSASRIRRRGWLQGEYGDSQRGHCAVGAMPYAVSVEIGLLNSAAIGEFSYEIGDVLRWNDAEGRTQAEVLTAFEDAAQIAESAKLTDAHWPEPSASPTPPLSSPSVATAPTGSPACPPTVATLGALGGEGGGT